MCASTSLDLQALPASKALAQELGSKHFFTGEPCSKGHICARLTSSGRCMECNKLKSRKYRETHSEKVKESARLAAKNWRAANLEKARENGRIAAKNWRAANPELARQRSNAAQLAYLKTPLGKIKNRLRSRIHNVLRDVGKVKDGRTLDYLGCTGAELVRHLESQFLPGMSWENKGEWHIDHIRPIASFDQPDDPECWHYTNLQPLWALDNKTKGARWEA